MTASKGQPSIFTDERRRSTMEDVAFQLNYVRLSSDGSQLLMTIAYENFILDTPFDMQGLDSVPGHISMHHNIQGHQLPRCLYYCKPGDSVFHPIMTDVALAYACCILRRDALQKGRPNDELPFFVGSPPTLALIPNEHRVRMKAHHLAIDMSTISTLSGHELHEQRQVDESDTLHISQGKRTVAKDDQVREQAPVNAIPQRDNKAVAIHAKHAGVGGSEPCERGCAKPFAWPVIETAEDGQNIQIAEDDPIRAWTREVAQLWEACNPA